MRGALAPLVLVVDDEASQRALLSYNLEASGFRVRTASDGEEALLIAAEEEPDVILLDWMLPRVSGIEVCRQLKARKVAVQAAVIMVSARSEESDRIRGLDTGADDYVVKPYSVNELVARVRANLRRVRPAQGGGTLQVGDLVLDHESHRVFRAGVELHLGPTEFRLLTALMEREGKVWTREALLDRVWGRDIYVDTRTVDVHVGRLRKALRIEGADDPIRTVRGAGYAIG
ncbi:MAG: phosphate regulon transcriptional regulator PhoB [Paracoccaceae bacterium]